jgi:methyl-accepting chemotaxis protein
MQANKRQTRMHFSSVTWLLAVFISSAIVLFTLLYWVTHSYLLHEVDERLLGEVAEFHSIGRAEAIADIAALSRRDVASSRPYGVFDADGTWLAGNIHTLPVARHRKPFYYTQVMQDGHRAIDAHFRGIIVPTQSGLRIVVGHSIDEIIDFDRTLVKMLCVGLMLTIILAVGCGAALNAMSNRRIRAISVTGREIMAGQLNRRLPTRGTHHDLDRLAEIVNTMLDEIERLVADVRGARPAHADDASARRPGTGATPFGQCGRLPDRRRSGHRAIGHRAEPLHRIAQNRRNRSRRAARQLWRGVAQHGLARCRGSLRTGCG